MTLMFDTPEEISFVKAAARKGALALEISTGMKKRGQTAYSIVKEVYGFRGSRESVLADLNEYIEAELRLKVLPDDLYGWIKDETQRLVEYLTKVNSLSQVAFEQIIADNERAETITYKQRQAMSDLFYVMIVRQNAGNR